MHITLKQRMLVLVGLPAATLVVTMAIASMSLRNMAQELADMGTEDMPLALAAAEADGIAADEQAALDSAIRYSYAWQAKAAGAKERLDAAYKAFESLVPKTGATIETARKLADKAADDLDPEVVATYKKVRELVDALNAAQSAYEAKSREALQMMLAGEHDKAIALLDGVAQLKLKLDESGQAVVSRVDEITQANVASADQAARNWFLLLLCVGLAGLLCAAGTGWWNARSLIAQLGGEPEMAVALARAVTSGDLTQRVPTREGDTTSIIANLGQMTERLAHTVGAVRSGSDSVATASAQIAQGNQDLSSRTEEQASALQQTAATMEQLGTTVRHNADSAKQANLLAQGATSVAEQGGAVVSQVVSTMQGISDSSRKIGDIISVIDGIAFQTNILALNAAVEAARAGEQGRGFAVVASEVRTLAQRSAEAAKEIKSLIGRSVEQVEQGTALVDQAGKTMGEIMGSIQRVSDIVAEITSASLEQSSGVQQVGNAVSQMDQATQQNAALVEEGAAAAESLKAQAQQLVQAVAVFKLARAA